MPRPHVQIQQPNQCDTLLAHLHTHLPRFIALPGVIAITLNGGLARGYGDFLSEIDVTFYLESAAYQHWMGGHAPFGVGIQRIDGALYDLKAVDLAQEDVATWSMVARWDASYAQVLHDPTGAITALLAENAQRRPAPADAGGPMFNAWWHFKLAGDIWLHRDDPLQAHHMLNQAVIPLVEAVFLANGEFVPHEKWLFHMSRSLDWTPENWIARLTQVTCELSPDRDGVQRRQSLIAALWQDVNDHLMATVKLPPSLNVTHRMFYDLMRLLVEQSPVPVSTWTEHAGLDMLNQAPFNLCVTVSENAVILDHDRCAALTADDLYTWHYAVVEALRERL